MIRRFARKGRIGANTPDAAFSLPMFLLSPLGNRASTHDLVAATTRESAMDDETAEVEVDLNDEGTTDFSDADTEGTTTDEGESGSDSTTHKDDPYHGMSREQIIRQYETAQARQTTLDERQNTLNEKLTAMLERTQKSESAAASGPSAADRVAALTKQTRERWLPKLEDDPTAVFDMLQDYGLDVLDITRAERAAELAAIKSETQSQLRALDPVYRANREQVDQLSELMGVSTEKAMDALKAMGKLNTASGVSQPGKVKAPGRTSDKGAAASASDTGIKLSAWEMEQALSIPGMTKEMVAQIAKDVAKDLAK